MTLSNFLLRRCALESAAGGRHMSDTFIFQMNPKEYRIWDALQHVGEHDNIIVLGPRRSRLLNKGSTVYLWQAANTGLVARGTVLEKKAPKDMPPWQHQFGDHGTGDRVVIRVDSVGKRPVSLDEIRRNPILRRAPFFRNRSQQGTLFHFDVPSKVRIELNKLLDGVYSSPSEVEASEDGIFEGARISVLVNVYERNREARRRCIALFGKACCVCGFDFQQKYGDIGTGFIEVHHLIPLHKIGKEYGVNPETDLRPVCPNCHAMLHCGNPLLSIEELKSRIS